MEGPAADHPGAPDAADPDKVDRALLDRHVAGDTDAFSELVRRHQDRMWAVAVRTMADRDEAADAVQDALLSAYRAAAGFRGEAKVSTWLHRIVVNSCLDRLRRQQSRPTVPLPDQELTEDTSGTAHVLRDPQDALANQELATDLGRALAVLPAEQRVAVVLVDAQGYPLDEVARLLSVPVGTIKSRCSRGRARLAVLLQDRGPGGNPDGASAVQPPSQEPKPRGGETS